MHATDLINNHFRLNKGQQEALKKLGLFTLRDLLYHFPTRFENITDVKHISDLTLNDEAIVYGYIEELKTRKSFRSRRPIAEGYVRDETGRIKIIWFNQPYLAKMLTSGVPAKVVGKVTGAKGKIYIANPEVEHIDGLPLFKKANLFQKETGQTLKKEDVFFPIYPESKGITSKWFYHKINELLSGDIVEKMNDPLSDTLLKRYHLPTLQSALVWIHTPKREKDALSARKRFAFEEVFYIQLAKQQDKNTRAGQPHFSIDVNEKELESFTKNFPFTQTNAQKRAIRDILSDFKGTHAMSRLLEGDVGSGKTAVAAATVYAVTTTSPRKKDGTRQDYGRLQTAYMVPTEILAKQHFESFISFFKHMPVNIGLITSSGCKKFPSKVDPSKSTKISKAQLLKWIANGEVPIVIGTHALIQKTVQFENLAYVIIDEQHRFGTIQRKTLVRKPARTESAHSGGPARTGPDEDNIVPHLLSMTATPIPRTLALTIYGDLDLTLLDEMPKGRKPIITEIVYPSARDKTYEKIREELRAGRQTYVICPRIDEPDPLKEQALNVRSVKEECARLKRDVFPEYEIEFLHSKMTPKEKEEVMERFEKNETHILVATSVVEVGVNVPNATSIIIEGAERFGLAQLHQLRGRVLRSNHQAYCFVFAETKSKKTTERLKALKTAKNGFELAEFDLSIRGGGELYGKRQSGLSDIAMEALKNIKMVEAAHKEAEALIKKDPKLKKSPFLQEIVEAKREYLHSE